MAVEVSINNNNDDDRTYLDASLIRRLTFAVFPLDDFTGKSPIGKLKVAIKELGYAAILNKSGYYLFLDLDEKLEDDHTLVIESEEKYYDKQSIPIKDVKEHDLENNPELQVSLIPNSSYPFGSGITLVRGTVITDEKDDNNNPVKKPVSGAKAEIKTRNLSAKSDERGNFVLYFKDLNEGDIIEKNKKKFIKMDMSTEFDLIVTCSGYKEFKKTGEVEVGTTAVFTALLVKEE